MMSSGIFDYKAFVALNGLQYMRLLDRPCTNIGPFLIGFGVFLLRVRWFPPRVPIVGELLKERCFDFGRLQPSC